ncbi:MAG TPA: mechanosensitive ion channel family protein [Planctomycetota bacterium]|nr:mechanosensitive ion channel family protein [Planctomycetota bacterium]
MRASTVLAALLTFATGRSAAQAPAQAHVAPDSPRAAVGQFEDLGREGRWDEMAPLLELPPDTPPADAPRLARRLKFVLDHNLALDVAQISGEADGNQDDGLAADTEEIGGIARRSGVEEPVRLVRVQDEKGARWLFSAATVARVDRWFSALKDRWVLEHLPPALLATGPFDLLWWQWLALPVALLASWFLGFFLARVSRAILGRIVARTKATWDDAVLARIGGPLTLAWLLAVLWALLPLVGLAVSEQEVAHQFLRSGLFFVVFWAALRSVDVLVQVVRESKWNAAHPAAHSLLPLGGRVIKVVVLALALISALASLGFQVGGLLAGVGIGGLALALAAQKTVENLVGAFAIGADQPFKEGDFVKIGEHQGNVEVIGLRSTRIRTPDRTLVTIPNAQVAEQRIESFAPRDRIRLAITVGIEYGATREQIQQVLSGFERVLRGHPRIWPETVVTRFANLGASALEIEVLCWFQTADFNEFRAFRQEVLLGFMEVVEQAGSGFAFPTQTVHVVQHEEKAAAKK